MADSSDTRYEYPYPAPELAERHPFVPLEFDRRPVDEMRQRADEFHAEMERRRSVRMLSGEPVPILAINASIESP